MKEAVDQVRPPVIGEDSLSLIRMLSRKNNIGLASLSPLTQVLMRSYHIRLPANGLGIELNDVSSRPETMTEVEVFISKGAIAVELSIESTKFTKSCSRNRCLTGDQVVK